MSLNISRSLKYDSNAIRDLEAALFRSMGSQGVWATTALYETIVDGLSRLIGRLRPEEAVAYRFPPVMSRSQIETNGYVRAFPNLLGCVSCLSNAHKIVDLSEAGAGENPAWDGVVGAADLVLTPASCYPVYPITAAEGRVAARGRLFDVGCDCFRAEPSMDFDRMQSFRMREFVCIGSPEQTQDFQNQWVTRAKALAETLGLSATIAPANDPFFGSGNSFLKAQQRAQKLKFELLTPVMSEQKLTACMSFNYHRDHFGAVWDIQSETGEVAHTACVAFGLDRLTRALFVEHGLSLKDWPKSVSDALAL
jgi:seryl-tRNA synthetase